MRKEKQNPELSRMNFLFLFFKDMEMGDVGILDYHWQNC